MTPGAPPTAGSDSPVPPGAQPERTALAWRRTALAVAAGSLVAARVLEPWAGPPVWLLALAGLAAAVGVAWSGARRARVWALAVDDTHPDRGEPGAPTPGGAPLAVTAAVVGVLGAAALVVVLAHPSR